MIHCFETKRYIELLSSTIYEKVEKFGFEKLNVIILEERPEKMQNLRIRET